MNDEPERIWKEAIVVLPQHLPGRIEENHEKRTVGVPAEIRTEDLPIHLDSLVFIEQSVTERCGQTLDTSSTYQNRKKMSISTSVRKHLICEL
jgi:hypothetical protein